MLSEYRRYLLGLRDSFIRCGVELSVSNVNGYKDIFYLSEKLSELLWFYTILGVSGSEDKLKNFIFPLDSFYMGKVRDKYFEDYLLYRIGYMQISVSDSLLREKRESDSLNKKGVKVEDEIIKADISYEDEDGFIIYVPSNDSVYNTGSLEDKQNIFKNEEYSSEEECDYTEDEYIIEDDDEFVSYGTEEDEDEFVIYDTEEDEFVNWGSDESIEVNVMVKDSDEEEDEFVNWVNDDESVSYDSDEDDFNNWGFSDEGEDSDGEGNDDEFINQGSSDEDDDSDDFGNWGSSGDEVDDFEEDLESFGNWGSSEEESDDYLEDEFDNWGSADEDYQEQEDGFSSWGSSEDEIEEQEDISSFDNWGSSEDDFIEENEDTDEDLFGSWGGEAEEEDSQDDEDVFGNWGTSSESRSSSEDANRGTVSVGGVVGDSVRKTEGTSKASKEIESNDKTAEVIEKIASSFLSRGSRLRSKMAEKIKNIE